MKTKIQIKSRFGSLLFEFEKEDNSILQTCIQLSIYTKTHSKTDVYNVLTAGLC